MGSTPSRERPREGEGPAPEPAAPPDWEGMDLLSLPELQNGIHRKLPYYRGRDGADDVMSLQQPADGMAFVIMLPGGYRPGPFAGVVYTDAYFKRTDVVFFDAAPESRQDLMTMAYILRQIDTKLAELRAWRDRGARSGAYRSSPRGAESRVAYNGTSVDDLSHAAYNTEM